MAVCRDSASPTLFARVHSALRYPGTPQFSRPAPGVSFGLALALAAMTATGHSAWAQAPAPQNSPDQQNQSAPVEPPMEHGNGKVLFSRSDGESTQASPKAVKSLLLSPVPESVAAKLTDTMRAAPVFTAYDLVVHLAPAQSAIAVQARVTLRNDGSQPLTLLPLQLSSSLHFEQVSEQGAAQAGVRLHATEHTIASDADHTGRLSEAVIELPRPLAPGASLTLLIDYSGTIVATTARLDRLATPVEVATASDWDRITEDFTGLRGFGDVVWYPVASTPALLGDGAKLFAEIGREKLRNQDAMVSMHVTEEFTGAAPTIAVLDGQPIEPGKPSVMPSDSYPGVFHVELPPTRLGFTTLGLFSAVRIASGDSTAPLRVYASESRAAAAQGYLTAATLVTPLISDWLGAHPKGQLALIDLPEAGASASQQGNAVFASLTSAEASQLAGGLSYNLAHVYFHSPRAWLNEGVAALMGSLWAEQSAGRPAALERLAASRNALALMEPESPGSGAGQDLLHASDAVYYRGKALYVLWMLRDLAGDKPLAAALRAYKPADDTTPEYFEHLVEKAAGKDLKWFFDAWVYHDMGLPDLSIAGAFPSKSAQAGQWLISLDIANDGYAEAEVPLTIHSAETAVTERIRIPGRSKISHRMLIAGEPTEVDLNDGTVPEVQASVHQRTITITQTP